MKKWARMMLGALLTATLVVSAAQISLGAGQEAKKAGMKKAKKEKSLYLARRPSPK